MTLWGHKKFRLEQSRYFRTIKSDGEKSTELYRAMRNGGNFLTANKLVNASLYQKICYDKFKCCFVFVIYSLEMLGEQSVLTNC
jgi:hypothetical protein